MNPYQWLGIDPQIKNPNHFQLLGIKNLVSDEKEFVQLVRKSVKTKLSLLDRPELAAHAEIAEKLKQRITLAGRVLADSISRNQYIEQLKTAAGGAKPAAPAAPSGSTIAPTKNSSANTSEGASTSPSPGLASAGAAPGTKATSHDEIPFAIPVRPAGQTNVPVTPSAWPAKPASKIRLGESAEAETSQDFSPLGGAILNTKSPIRKKNSPLLMIAGSLMLLIALSGLVLVALTLSQPRTSTIADAGNPIERAALNNFASNQFDVPSNKDDLKPGTNLEPVPAAEMEIKPETEVKPEAEIKPETEVNSVSELGSELESNPPVESKQQAPESKPEDGVSLERDQVAKDSRENIQSGPTVTKPTSDRTEGETEPDPATEQGSAKPLLNDESSTSSTTANPRPDAARVKNQTANVWEVDSESDLLTLAEADQYLIDKHLRIILNRQRLRNAEVAEHTDELLDYMEKLYFENNPGRFSPYRRIVLSFKQINQYLDGFWDQFEESAATIPGGQEIIVSDRPLSFVEYAGNQLVMRGQGFNIRYQREYIPVELAIKIAEQGAIPDIPSWRLYLSAFLATQLNGHLQYQERIAEMLELSIEDGQDVSGIQDYLSFRADPRSLKLKAEMPDMSAIAAVTRKVQDNSSGLLGVKMDELKLDELYDFWIKWEFLWFSFVHDSDDQPELEGEKPLIHTSLALLHNAIQVAIMAKDAAKLEEALVELGYLTGQNTDKLFLEHLTKIATQKLDLKQAIELKRVSDPLIARVQEDKKLRPLANRIKRPLETFERKYKIMGTGQTFGELR